MCEGDGTGGPNDALGGRHPAAPALFYLGSRRENFHLLAPIRPRRATAGSEALPRSAGVEARLGGAAPHQAGKHLAAGLVPPRELRRCGGVRTRAV